MRKIVVSSLYTSADGVAEEPQNFLRGWDEVMAADLATSIGTIDTYLIGRRQYDQWATFWPNSKDEPFASFINNVPKFVVTSSPLETQWNAAEVLPGEPGEPLAKRLEPLRSAPGGDIGVGGSISLVQSMLAEGLVDELRLMVTAYIAGSGRRLFDGAPAGPLELTSARSTPTGTLLLRYQIQR